MMEFKYLTVLASFEIIQTKKVICIPFYFSIILSNSTKISKYASLFQAGMGQFDHGYHTDSTKVGLGSPKLVTLFLSLFDLPQKSHFWNVFLNFFWKLNNKIFRGPQAWQKIESLKFFWNFFAEILIFSC